MHKLFERNNNQLRPKYNIEKKSNVLLSTVDAHLKLPTMQEILEQWKQQTNINYKDRSASPSALDGK